MESTDNQEYSQMFEERISPFIKRLMRQKHITGLSAALVDEGGIVAGQGYGFADRGANRPADLRTVYRIGSITKLFTGIAAVQLVEKGLFNLDKPVGEYLPEFSLKASPDDLAKITPRTLMTHHSGLPADWYADYWSTDPHAFRQVIEYLRNCALAFSPNTVFSYSNLATSLMGILIERVSGLSYQDYIQEYLLDPLRMTESGLHPDDVAPSILSKAYAMNHEVDEPILRDAPAGAILSSVGNMARFVSMVLAGGTLDGKCILGPRVLADMLTTQNTDVERDFGFQVGLNWFLSRPSLGQAGRVGWHDGGSPHFFSIVIALPDAKLGAVVLSNSDGGMVNVGVIADEMLRQALRLKTLERPAVSKSNQRMRKTPALETPEGLFATPNGLVEIYRKKNNVRARMQNMELALSPDGDGWYAPKLLLVGLLPVRVASLKSLRFGVCTVSGQRVLGIEQYGLRVAFGEAYSSVEIPAAWSASLGTYRLVTADPLPPFTSLELAEQRRTLLIRVTARKAGKMSLVIRPTSDTSAVVLGFGRVGGVAVELTSQGNAKKLSMVGLEFVKP